VKWNKTGLSKAQTEVALRALDKGRLAFKVLDQHGRNTNTYGAPQIQYHLPKNGKPGKWMPKIENVAICERGYHVTTKPHKWSGCTVYLVESRGESILTYDKSACGSIRIIAPIQPDSCIEAAILCRILFPYLQGAYLRRADLRGADLQGAYLQGAYLRRADLQWADLRGADLQGADLQGAYLRGADLRGADLQGAYLRRADRYRSDLTIPGWTVDNSGLLIKEG